MAQASKYIAAPWKMNSLDTYGDPAEVFTTRLFETGAAVGLQNAYFPAAADIDNGSANLLDWGDHNLWMCVDGGSGVHRDYSGSFVYSEGAVANWKPAVFYRGNLNFRNIGETTDLPTVSAPSWYRGGSIDLIPTSSDGNYGIQFRLKPSTTYTYSFYVKKLASGSFRFAVGTGSDTGLGSGNIGTQAQQENKFVQSVNDGVAAPNVWTRLSATFTTSANGYIWVWLGGWFTWGSSLTLRLAFPKLEEAEAASAWAPPRYWKYHEFPTSVDIDDTINDANYAAMLGLSLPGSAAAMRLDVSPDWVNTSGTTPRWQRIVGVDGSTDQTTDYRPGRSDSWNQYTPFWEWSHLILSTYLGLESWGVIRYGSGNSYRLKGKIKGVWIKHTPNGGFLLADSDSTSGPGHKKLLAWRMTDLGSNQFRLKLASVAGSKGFMPTGIDCRYTSQSGVGTPYDNTQSNTYSGVYLGYPSIQGILSLTLNKSQDLFLDAVGNNQGLVLNFYQNSAYGTPLAIADFLEPPAPSDDGSLYHRWGMLVPHNRVGYQIAACGPSLGDYWPGWGPNFSGPVGWGNSNNTGEPPVPYLEIALGQTLGTRLHMNPLWAVRSDAIAANRGRLGNFYLARNTAFSGSVGDSWLAQDGTRYYLAHKSSTYNGYAETYLLFVKP